MKNSPLQIILTFLVLLSSSAYSAGGWYTKDATVDQITVEDGIIRVAITKNDEFAIPDGCDIPGTAVITEDNTNATRQYSLIMAAMMAGKRVRIYSSGCYERWGGKYPIIYSLQVDK